MKEEKTKVRKKRRKFPSKGGERFVKTKASLCILLGGIARTTLDAWLRLPEAPKARSDGRYEVEEWREFAANRKSDRVGDEVQALKMENLRMEVEKNKLEALKQAGSLIPLEWCQKLFLNLALRVKEIIQHSGLNDKDVEKLTEKIAAIKYDDYLSELRQEISGDLGEIPSGIEGGRMAEGQATVPNADS